MTDQIDKDVREWLANKRKNDRIRRAGIDLLAACRAGVHAIEMRMAENRGMTTGYESAFLSLARAAIEKATEPTPKASP